MNQPGAHLVDVDGMPRRSHYHLVFAVLAGLLGMVAPTSTAAAAATAVVVLSPANGLAGSNTTLAASGFPRRTAARVTVGTSSFTLQTDRLGRVTQSIRIPQTATGDVAVTVTTSTSTATARFHVSPAEPRFGVSTPGGPAAASELDEVTSLAGEAPSIVMFYRGFGAGWTSATSMPSRQGERLRC